LAFSYWFDKPQFLTEGILADVLITPSLGVPNWSVIINTAQQSTINLEECNPIAWITAAYDPPVPSSMS
jgi:hypothetical protein